MKDRQLEVQISKVTHTVLHLFPTCCAFCTLDTGALRAAQKVLITAKTSPFDQSHQSAIQRAVWRRFPLTGQILIKLLGKHVQICRLADILTGNSVKSNARPKQLRQQLCTYNVSNVR